MIPNLLDKVWIVPAIMAAVRRYLSGSYLNGAGPLGAQSAKVAEIPDES